MNYFKDLAGNVFSYDDEQVAAGLAGDKAPMTPEEAYEHANPTKTAEQLKLIRAAEIKARLLDVDAESVRPMRAKLAGTATTHDDAKLAALDAEAAALRNELSGL